MSHFLWVDLETTGLDPDKDLVLEAAFVLTDDDFLSLDSETFLFEPGPALHICSDFVRQMHTDNGLWDDLEKVVEPYDYMETGSWVLDMLLRCEVPRIDKGDQNFFDCQLAGSTVGFDQSFLKLVMPNLIEDIHYRSLDISSIKTFFSLDTDIPWDEVVPKHQPEHRAMPDVLTAIDTAIWIRENLS